MGFPLQAGHELVVLYHNPTAADPHTVGVPVFRAYTNEQGFQKALHLFGLSLTQYGTDSAMLLRQIDARIEDLKTQIEEAKVLRDQVETGAQKLNGAGR